ncbi:hypothetical protein [Nocardia rhizosphaerae]|uniref:Uncharacterized protein n=1 Tax=Nocardia rhizosphaerae TaxID=1691571 RepID=A0ABV8LAY0_9NOCA
MRNRRDRDRAACPACGKQVTITRSGRPMAHKTADGMSCVGPAWKERQQ